MIVTGVTAPKDFVTVNTNSLDRTKAGHKLLLQHDTNDFFISDICEIRPNGVRIIPKQIKNDYRGFAAFKAGNITSYEWETGQLHITVAEAIANVSVDSHILFHKSGLINKVGDRSRDHIVFLSISVTNNTVTIQHAGSEVIGTLNPDAEIYIVQSNDNINSSSQPLMINVAGDHLTESMLTFRDCAGEDAAAFANKIFNVLHADFISPNNTTNIYLDAGKLTLQDTAENRQIRLDGYEVTALFNVLNGLNHLEGEAVDVLADGEIIKNQVVTNGKITLERFVSYAVAGYRYQAVFQTLPYFGGKMTGSSVGSISSCISMHMRLYYSFGGRYGTSPKNMQPITESSFTSIGLNESAGTKCALRSGDLVLRSSNDCLRARILRVEHDDPRSFNVQAYGTTINVRDN